MQKRNIYLYPLTIPWTATCWAHNGDKGIDACYCSLLAHYIGGFSPYSE